MPSVAHIIRRRRNRKERRQDVKQQQRLWLSLGLGSLFLAFFIPMMIVLGLAGFLYGRAIHYMPSPAETIYIDPLIGATELFDRQRSTLLYAVQDPLGNNRQWMTIESLPTYVIDATLQMEDRDFLLTGGFNFGQTLAQLWRYILGQPNRRENSIAALLAENTLMGAAAGSDLDEDLLRIAMTAEVQRRYTPRRVLEWYLNTAYYGNDAYGLDAAAQVYFGKSAGELSLDEAALLATIPPAPQFNPIDNETEARGRQRVLLLALHNTGIVTQADYDSAVTRDTPIRRDLAQAPYLAPSFAVYAREQAEEILDRQGYDGARLISRGGLTITTTLDLDLYYQTECTLRAHLAQLNGGIASAISTLHGQPCIAAVYLRETLAADRNRLPDNGAIVIYDVRTGEIRAMVGDADESRYEPAPVLHPFVYLAGFLSGNYNPGKMLLDIPQQFAGIQEGLIYTPSNPDGVYRGVLNLRDAMVAGLRTPAAEVADREGMNDVISIAHRLGINGLSNINSFDLSLIERGGDVSVLDIAYAYSVFALMGDRVGVDTTPIGNGYRARNPVAVLKIEDAQGNVLWDYDSVRQSLSRTPILEDEIAYLVNHILSDNSTRRNILNIDDSLLNIARPAALVNGLSRDKSDSWTVGYTPQLVTAVHLGRLDEESLSLDTQGWQGAPVIWQALMRYSHDYYSYEAAGWTRPAGIVDYIICEKSGLIRGTNSACPARPEIYYRDAPPTQEDTFWRTVRINSQTRLLASSSTPDYLIIEEVYFEPPLAARDWWVSNNQPLPPTNYDTLTRPEAFSTVQIFQPLDFSYVGASVDIQGSMATEGLVAWRLRYGAGFNPTQWFDLGTAQTSFSAGQSLGTWNTSNLDGLYTLELSVEYADGQRETAGVHVTVDNQAPLINIATADTLALYRFPQQTVIPLRASAQDAISSISRVEFYVNGALLFIDSDAPYEYDFTIERTGSETFSATAFDQVGNQATADLQIEVIRSGG